MTRSVTSSALITAKWHEPPFETADGFVALPVRHKVLWAVSNRGLRHLIRSVVAVWRDGAVEYGGHWACGEYGGRIQLLADDVVGLTTCRPCALAAEYGSRGTPVVYRYVSTDGKLLYVGSTANLAARVLNHEKRSPWWRPELLLRVERYASLTRARAAEVFAIAQEHPQHNILHRAQVADAVPA